MTAAEKREAVAAKYRTIIGRNLYSQDRRRYCYTKYSDGKYYSDCSSSISLTYKECGMDFGVLNTVGMYQSKDLVDVDVPIKNGQIQDISKLRVGDMLLFAGTDSSRSYAGYVGHVEMVGEIKGNTVYLYGHGSGNPKRHEMTAYCKSRYNSKTSTKLGHKGLIRVRRFIRDDATPAPEPEKSTGKVIEAGTWNLRQGPGTEYPAFTTVSGGSAVSIVDAGDWVFVRVGSKHGWIRAAHVKEV